MCLYVDKKKTEAELKDHSVRIFIKVFFKKDKGLLTPYMKYSVSGPGVYTAPESRKPFTDMVGDGAFHARTDLNAIKQDLFWIEQFDLGTPVIHKVTVKAEHLIAFGNQDNVAYKTFEITKEDWDNPLKK